MVTPILQLVVGPCEDDNEKFGLLLEDLRLAKGLTRAEAAKEIGISSEYIRLIERGKRVPAAGQMRHILHTYGKTCVVGRNQVAFDDVTIQFTSRIQAAREKLNPNEMIAVEDLPRAERIGLILDMLVRADEKKLRQVHNLLRKD